MTRTVPAAGIQPASAEDTRAVFAGLLAFNQARTLGAHAVTPDTFSWQAEGFYLKQGYEVFGRLQAFPPGRQRLYLRKRL
ncbi:hypothetical protein ABE473_08640 [Stenotrophomonas sp. TWI700]|uniref:hypothetical protein n=1 Tax=Stenotrophomonas sp. TWI700 TaxID=3136792 RepID=UPI003208C89F